MPVCSRARVCIYIYLYIHIYIHIYTYESRYTYHCCFFVTIVKCHVGRSPLRPSRASGCYRMYISEAAEEVNEERVNRRRRTRASTGRLESVPEANRRATRGTAFVSIALRRSRSSSLTFRFSLTTRDRWVQRKTEKEEEEENK